MVRHGLTGTVRVDPATHAVTLDGSLVEAPPVEDLRFSGRFLLG
jgi:urease alpha subunit